MVSFIYTQTDRQSDRQTVRLAGEHQLVFLFSVLHDEIYMTGCSASDGEEMYGLDGDVLFYADFKNKKGVYPQPDFVGFRFVEGVYQTAEANQQICKQSLDVSRKALKDFPLESGRDKLMSVVSVSVLSCVMCDVSGHVESVTDLRAQLNCFCHFRPQLTAFIL